MPVPAVVEELQQEIVMPVEGMVGVALAGLDQGEFVTIPSLPDAGQRQSYEAARQALRPNLSRAEPAARYGIVRVAAWCCLLIAKGTRTVVLEFNLSSASGKKPGAVATMGAGSLAVAPHSETRETKGKRAG